MPFTKPEIMFQYSRVTGEVIITAGFNVLGTRSKSLISLVGEVIITAGFNVLGTHSKSLISLVGEVIITYLLTHLYQSEI